MDQAVASGDVPQFEGDKVGAVTHFFDKITVAVILPEKEMKVGDTIRFYDKEGNVAVEQQITSMEIDGQKQESVPAGSEFGLKVDGMVKEGYLVYRQ